ncbi:hypothetical protein VIBNISFn118_1280022 [Vibrio nigripulchritudo SFn118]|nr:hypothetical protein VIBNISFn118_1280022 [Vibrio nigripulchritudo SFn118]
MTHVMSAIHVLFDDKIEQNLPTPEVADLSCTDVIRLRMRDMGSPNCRITRYLLLA